MFYIANQLRVSLKLVAQSQTASCVGCNGFQKHGVPSIRRKKLIFISVLSKQVFGRNVRNREYFVLMGVFAKLRLPSVLLKSLCARKDIDFCLVVLQISYLVGMLITVPSVGLTGSTFVL